VKKFGPGWLGGIAASPDDLLRIGFGTRLTKILVVSFLFSSVFFIVFPLFRAVPAKAQAGSCSLETEHYLFRLILA